MFGFSLFSVIAFALLEKTRKSGKIESISTPVLERCSASNGGEKGKSVGEDAKDGPMRFATLLLCIALSGAYFGSILPSVLSYATLPFSSATYYWAFILGQIGLAVGSFLPFCVIARSLTTTVLLTALATASTAILIAFAAASPHPWLEKSVAGSIVSITASIVAFTLSGYLRASISAVVKDDSPNDESRLFWSGFFTQAGAFIGACIMCPLINVVEVFHSAPEC